MTRFLLTLFIASLLIAALPAIAAVYRPDLLIAGFWPIFLFFFGITFIVCISVIIGQQKDAKLGVQVFMGATTIKLLACMTFALVYIKKMPLNGPLFILNFFYLYLCFTAFEIYTLLSNLRVQNKK